MRSRGLLFLAQFCGVSGYLLQNVRRRDYLFLALAARLNTLAAGGTMRQGFTITARAIIIQS